MKRTLLSLIAIVMLTGLSDAAVTSKSVTVTPYRAIPTLINLDLTSSQALAGIQGQINYDPAIFSNPAVFGGVGLSGFTVMGNLVAPGQYRFVAYANPTKSMSLAFTALQFRLDTSAALPQTGSRTITYTYEAASTTDGQSISSVDFSNVNVVFQRNSAKDSWVIYQ
jgi:hypothetical protein